MEDIFHWCREGNAIQVRVWLDDTEHDLNQGDDHNFSPLHWACKEGHIKIVEMLLLRGARVNATNRGDDIPLHLAAAHGHRDIVLLLLRNKADVNFINEHGNTPLHYACFWGYKDVAEDLVHHGALVSVANKYGETPLDKCKSTMQEILKEIAKDHGQDFKVIKYKDQSSLGYKTRSRDATLSRYKGISLGDLRREKIIGETQSGTSYFGVWQKTPVVCKILKLREVTSRISRDFNEEFPKLRIFSHPNVLPVLSCVNEPPNLAIINQYMKFGSLHRVLHQNSEVTVDAHQALRFAVQIARGMSFLHSLERIIPEYFLNSYHVMIDEDLTARINMADCKFSFQEKGRLYYPEWMSPEALQKKINDRNWEASDMWSFAIILWELATREVPFSEFGSPMEIGMKIALEGLRVEIDGKPGISSHLSKLIHICMNEDPGKRPKFDMVVPILDKMLR